MTELPDKVHLAVQKLTEEATQLLELGETNNAVAKFESALELLPQPRQSWSAATWIHTAIGDAWIEAGALEKARKALELAASSPDGIDNPFVQLRYGQVLYDLGKADLAVQPLARAAMAGGVTLFADADRLDLIEVVDQVLAPPEGYDSWVEYTESGDWEEAEGRDCSDDEEESGAPEQESRVDRYSSDEQRVSDQQAEFWDAIEQGHTELVRQLLAQVEIDAVVPAGISEGMTALALAADAQNSELVRILLAAGADPNASGARTLPLISGRGSLEVTTLLLDAGAHLEARKENDWTPLFAAIQSGDPEVIRLLIERGANVQAICDGQTIWEVAKERADRKLLDLLKRAGANRPTRV